MMEWEGIVSTVGFPIAITLYLLLRFERVIGENTKTVRELTYMVRSLNGKKR